MHHFSMCAMIVMVIIIVMILYNYNNGNDNLWSKNGSDCNGDNDKKNGNRDCNKTYNSLNNDNNGSRKIRSILRTVGARLRERGLFSRSLYRTRATRKLERLLFIAEKKNVRREEKRCPIHPVELRLRE